MNNVQSVTRALTIIDTLARENKAMTLTALSAELKLNISTVHRLLATLIAANYVQQEPETGKYKLSLKLYEIGNSVIKNINVQKLARPFLKELSEKFDETINLALLDGQEVIYIDQIESKHVVKMLARPGTRAPSYCTGSGKALLPKYSDNELKKLFQKTAFIKHTANSVGSVAELIASITEVRKKGYAIDREEMEDGVRCAAVAIHNHESNIIAAISVSGPAHRLDYDYLEASVVAELLEASKNISRLLGNY